MAGQGRYTLDRKVAEGGMAEIFLARQHGSQGFEKPVILKRIHTAYAADEQFRNMLIDEAHISMTLGHANIVQVLDLGSAEGRYFLVLELVDGWDLARLLDRAARADRRLPIGLGAHIVVSVCRALAFAHARTGPDGAPLGIVHRDVSPQNVLVSEQGDVKLADFGIAKAMGRRDRTSSGVVKGKLAFMAPEQARGERLDARSDIFAAGTLLYLVATGHEPFDGDSPAALLARVQQGDFRPPEQVEPKVGPALSAIIARAMAKDRDQRYATAEEMLADLEELLRAEYGSPGQTEFKHWLSELSAADGVPPINRAPSPTAGDPASRTSEATAVLGDEPREIELGRGEDVARSPTVMLAMDERPSGNAPLPRLSDHERVSRDSMPLSVDGLPETSAALQPPRNRRPAMMAAAIALAVVGAAALVITRPWRGPAAPAAAPIDDEAKAEVMPDSGAPRAVTRTRRPAARKAGAAGIEPPPLAPVTTATSPVEPPAPEDP